MPLFYPKRHTPATNFSYDVNRSPVKGYAFAAFLPIQNLQLLTNHGGINKHYRKYIGNMDKETKL